MKKTKLLTLLPVLLLTSCGMKPTEYNSKLVDMDITYSDGFYHVFIDDKEFEISLIDSFVIVSNVDKVILVDYPAGPDMLYFYTTLNYGEE